MSAPVAHVKLEELADAAAGALEEDRRRAVVQHVDGCTSCRRIWAAIVEVGRRLASEPAPPMPPDVARRLTDVLRDEGRRRSAAGAVTTSGPTLVPKSGPRSVPRSVGEFGADLPSSSRRRAASSVLAACGAAAAVGAAGYLVSASVGLNEPSAVAPAAINSSRLDAQASAVERGADVDPHRFSKAWRCARQVVPGQITGLTPATVGGRPALLVYSVDTDTGVSAGVPGLTGEPADAVRVSVVTGCATGKPTAGPSTTLPR